MHRQPSATCCVGWRHLAYVPRVEGMGLALLGLLCWVAGIIVIIGVAATIANNMRQK
jgi:hypothetical protein